MFGFLRRKKRKTDVAETTEESAAGLTDSEAAPGEADAEPAGQQTESADTPTSEPPRETDTTESAAPTSEETDTQRQESDTTVAATPAASSDDSGSLFSRLAKTRSGLTEGLGDLFLGKKKIDDDMLEELETRLIMADVGQQTTMALIDELTDEISRKHVDDPERLFETLHRLMVERLTSVQPATPPSRRQSGRPHVMVVCGINGGGKTTSIGKLAHRFKGEGRNVTLAAADTFRAAAVEQLIAWGERNDVRVIGEPGRGDPASVAFDAVSSAKARGSDMLIVDTAGRLHTQSGLMDELGKLIRVIGKAEPEAPDEVLLVIDASIGQNALIQARQFNDAVKLTGLIVTKLDGTAKGGIVFAIAEELGLPIHFIGVGEKSEDLRPFEPRAFVDALLDHRPD
ncbi:MULTISPECIES: signal recognition particle-docking protein FtsY [unclassified Guyparkeria]|uniref:signal recognition particle-docking protein FtsY n=1 Tax=unclassified Guyparkeria TaxID=2626246 RepID=UPI0007338184|nr:MULTISPECIES: signal recognition particle-docking protein FtsY [unclassified Guyparkeria]KTG16056.1 signal recognition particle-docking protein FtsY [Guyparkeria sp. XI15]OAE84907.1 signal recognition particle-docking protein FtsY [Guyparkeria sp. WRN-7]